MKFILRVFKKLFLILQRIFTAKKQVQPVAQVAAEPPKPFRKKDAPNITFKHPQLIGKIHHIASNKPTPPRRKKRKAIQVKLIAKNPLFPTTFYYKPI